MIHCRHRSRLFNAQYLQFEKFSCRNYNEGDLNVHPDHHQKPRLLQTICLLLLCLAVIRSAERPECSIGLAGIHHVLSAGQVRRLSDGRLRSRSVHHLQVYTSTAGASSCLKMKVFIIDFGSDCTSVSNLNSIRLCLKLTILSQLSISRLRSRSGCVGGSLRMIHYFFHLLFLNLSFPLAKEKL